MSWAGMNRSYTCVLVCLALLLAASGCSTISPHTELPSVTQLPAENTNISVGKVEVYHFHGDRQCASCIAVGDLAEKTIHENFKDELASGRLVFAHVNAQQPGNAALAAKYEVTGSSLWIGVYDANGFRKEEDLKVWSLINNKEAYAAHLTALIAKRLNGDLS